MKPADPFKTSPFHSPAPVPVDRAPMISVCSHCHRQLFAGQIASGPPLEPAPNHSHGVCVACLQIHFHDLGISEADVRSILGNVRD